MRGLYKYGLLSQEVMFFKIGLPADLFYLNAVHLHMWPWGQQMSYLVCVWPLVHIAHIKVLKVRDRS